MVDDETTNDPVLDATFEDGIVELELIGAPDVCPMLEDTAADDVELDGTFEDGVAELVLAGAPDVCPMVEETSAGEAVLDAALVAALVYGVTMAVLAAALED